MKKSNRLLSMFLCLAILITSLVGFTSISYAATRSFTSGDLSCTLDTDTGVFTVKGSGRGAGYANSATKRAPWYTAYRSQIKSVIIENGVIEIGAYWFYNCANLTSVTFADSVDTIGDCCFRSCTSLQNITLPKNCSWYYKELFRGCTALKWAIMPEINRTDSYGGRLPDGTFRDCTSLEEVYIGPGYTAIDSNAFNNCRSLHGVIWNSGSITNVGTDALNSVPNSCVFFSPDNSLRSWASSYNKAALSLNGSCSNNGSLSYSLDTNDRVLLLNFSGSGTMTSTPWTNFRYLIKDISFSGTDNSFTIAANAFNGAQSLSTVAFNKNCPGILTIGDGAFQNCTGSTYWLDIPKNCTDIGNNAFNNTNFNWVKFYSPELTIPADAFGSGYARFYGLHNSGAYDFYKAGKANGANWEYHCLVDADGSVTEPNAQHEYTVNTIKPTCTDIGHDEVFCAYCDNGTLQKNFTQATGHTYINGAVDNNGMVLYTCSDCGQNNLKLTPLHLLSLFEKHISLSEDNPAFNQSNYLAKFDLYNDGFINAKDFGLLNTAAETYANALINDSSTFINKNTTVDTTTTYQTIDGFGASGAWWAQDVGRWNDEQIDRITELLYGESGAGLDIYRYNLGGGSENDTYIGDWRRRAEDFLSPTSNINDASTYDWNADAAAQKVLASVKKANPDFKLTLFSNSAPVSITDNGKAYCSNGVNQNLSESNYQSFANYVVNCAEHFIDEGYNVTSVSPINEPEWDWAADSNGYCSQEGCHFTAEAARNFYNNYMVPSLRASAKLNGKVNLSVWECAQLNHSNSELYKKFLPNMFSSQAPVIGTNYAKNNENIRDYCNSLDTHSYWASTSDRNTVASDISGSSYSAIEEVRCTEYCQMTNDGSSGCYNYHTQEGQYVDGNGIGMYYALALADIIHQDLTILNAVEWDWWTACSSGIYPDGLIYVDYDNPDNIQTAKRLWVMGNYAKFIQEGAKRVKVTTGSAFGKNLKTEKTYGNDKINYIEQSAYVNPDGSIVIVYINNSDTDEYTYINPGSDSQVNSFETYVTDASRNLEKYQSSTVSADKKSSMITIIPAKSVTTVVVK